MGYACPVCETPHPDAEHLANHLAFTALLGDDDHEAWLESQFPEWEEAGERELADRVEEHAKEVEYPQVFEDTTHDHGRHDDEVRPGDLYDEESPFDTAARRSGGAGDGAGVGAGGAGMGGGGAGDGQLDAETQQILQEAREMTEEMVEDAGGEDGTSEGEGGATDEDADDASEDETE